MNKDNTMMNKIKQITLPLFVGLLVAISGCPKEAPKVGGGDEEPYVCPQGESITETPTNKAALQTLVNAAITTESPSPDLNHIDVSNVTDMRDLFKDKINFNGDISCWETSQVTTMENMFQSATNFNGNLSKWNTGKVATMSSMFNNAKSFNGDISKWDTREVTDMQYMFTGAIAFNRNIATDGNYWNTSKVRHMISMFRNATAFNQDLTNWDVSSVGAFSHSGFANNTGFATDTTKHPKWCDNADGNKHMNCSP